MPIIILSVGEVVKILSGMSTPKLSSVQEEICRAQVLSGICYLTDRDPKWVPKIKKPIQLNGCGSSPWEQTARRELLGMVLEEDLFFDYLAMNGLTVEHPYDHEENLFKNELWNRMIGWIRSLISSTAPPGSLLFFNICCIIG